MNLRILKYGAVGAVVAGTIFAAGMVQRSQPAAQRPLVFIFQKQKDPVNIRAKADQLAALISKEIGRPVEAFVPTEYAASVQALVSRRADFAYVSAIPFLLARRDGDASILLAEVREDLQGVKRTTYDSVFVVRDDSPLQSIGDLVADAARLRVCFTSTTSTSGYVMAYSRLVREGLLKPRQDVKEVFRSVSFGGSYTDALRQVLDGRADVCAVSFYTVEGPRADAYLPEKDRERLRVLARTPSVPTHVIVARGGIDQPTRDAVKAALLKIAEEHQDLLAAVYGARWLTEVDEDEHIAPAVEALEYLGLPIESLAR